MPAQLPSDPWLTRAMRHYALLARHEPTVLDAVTDAQRDFLTEARTAVITPVTAAAKRRSWWNPLQRLFRWPDRSTWVALLKKYVLPALKRVYREITDARTDEPPEEDWWPAIEVEFVTAMERDSWSDQLYDTVRDEIEDSRTHDDPLSLVRDRLARLLSIDAPVRRIRDTFVRRARKGLDYDPTLRPGDYTHRNSARTRARFYTVAACNRATLDAALREQRVTGQQLYTAWMSTDDDRVRPSHVVADGQSVPLGHQFLVGGAKLRYPGDPLGPPEETQNCRCALVVIGKDEHNTLANRSKYVTGLHYAASSTSVLAADAGEWSGGHCVDDCMDAGSPVAECVCRCGGVNHGIGSAAAAVTVEPVDEMPNPTDDQKIVMGIKEGDKDEARQRLRKWHQETFPGPGTDAYTQDEHQTVVAYTWSAYEEMNRALRTDDPGVRKVLLEENAGGKPRAERIKEMASAIDKGSLPQDVTVYRGLPKDLVENLTTGDSMKDPGFMSTSVDPNTSMSFGDAVLEINAPKGTGYASGAIGEFPHEKEIILQAGSQVRILGVEHGENGKPFIKGILEGQ